MVSSMVDWATWGGGGVATSTDGSGEVRALGASRRLKSAKIFTYRDKDGKLQILREKFGLIRSRHREEK